MPSEEAAQALATAFVERLVERFCEQPDKLAKIHAALMTSGALDDPALPSESMLKPPYALKSLYKTISPLLASDPDLSREFLQYVPASCYTNGTNGHVHITVPQLPASGVPIS